MRPLPSTTQRIQSRGHSPRTICTGAPTLSVHRRRAGVEARPYGGLRGLTDYVIAPHQRRPQPLSHGASRRDSSPFRGAKGWVKVCGVYTSVYHYADTVVFLPPVRGGVPDAPRSCDCRASSNASIRPDRFYPRHPRCARLCPPPSVCDFAGTARAPLICARERTPCVTSRNLRHATTVRGGVLDAPRSRDRRAGLAASVRPDRFYPRHPRSSRLSSASQRIQIPRAQPAHHFMRANPSRPSSHPGRAWKPSPTVGGEVSARKRRRPRTITFTPLER